LHDSLTITNRVDIVLQPAKINAAIHQCLDRLPSKGSVIDHLAAYVGKLHEDTSWSEEDIKEVEVGARHILAVLTK
jgi:hypothetical protein